MKVFATAAALFMATTATANPFAPKMTKNTAKANYVGRLMRSATPTEGSQLRRLQDEADVDLSTYSIKFEKCQFVKQYNGGQGNNHDNNKNNNNKNGVDTILATKRFIVFRLCPDGACSSCNYNYGEYIVDMDTYLQAALEYKQEEQQAYCEACNECVVEEEEVAEDAEAEAEAEGGERRKLVNVDCSTCYDECQSIENMEANGYVDASQYAQCNKLYQDEYGVQYYAGAMCANSGSRIKIGVFYDQYCTMYDENADIESYLVNNDGASVKLSYHLLKQTYIEGDCMASCLKVNDNGNQEVNEMCGNLYDAAGKCETKYGFANGIVNYDNYDNQVAQEELVCDFISSLQLGTYDSSGDIVIAGGRSTIAGGVATTGGQKFALTFFILGSVGLAGYAAMLHSQLTKGAKADLSRQGGAMA